MIRINIGKSKDKIIKLHKKNFGSKCKKITDALGDVSHFSNFRSWFENRGVIDLSKIERLICADSKEELLKLIIEIEPLIHQDAAVNSLLPADVKKEIENVFGNLFSNFSNRDWAFEFIRLTDAKVCPYCNRCYTFAVNKKGHQRPDFDHYFPKSKYPYLAISIFNLVPCCSACNKGKGDNFVDKDNQVICYPYENSFEDSIVFETDFDDIDEWFDSSKHMEIKLNGTETDIIKAYNKAFKIDELYSLHDDYTREVIKKAVAFNEDFFEGLFHSFPEMFDSPDEVRQVVFANYLDPDKLGKRPLSKLTKDILNELQVKVF